MPNVAINSMMSGWLTSGRSTNRSMPTARAYMIAIVASKAIHAGTPVLVQPHQRQRREHHHDALREIEDARGFVDEHEAERDQRIEHAADETLPDRLDEQVRRRDHLREGVDENRVQEVHRLRPQCATPR